MSYIRLRACNGGCSVDYSVIFVISKFLINFTGRFLDDSVWNLTVHQNDISDTGKAQDILSIWMHDKKL